jgi:hypothetical protein
MVFVALVALGCSSASKSGTTGSSSSSGGGTGGAMTMKDAGSDVVEAGTCKGPSVPGNTACEECQNTKCCVTASNCESNPECVALEACLAGDASPDCATAHPMGLWDQSGLDVCRQNQCATECKTATAMCGAIVPSPATCQAKVYAACCMETAACGASDACIALVYQCLDKNQCGMTGPCYQDCRMKYPDALMVFDAMAACWGTVSC